MAGRGSDPESASLGVLRHAARLDWSQCPAVESVPRKSGMVWVFRGAGISLADIFRHLDAGHPVEQILAYYHGLSKEQLNAALRFAAGV